MISPFISSVLLEMGSSEPLPIAEGDKRKKKKRKSRAADFLPGKFEGWWHYSLRSDLWLFNRGRSLLKPLGLDHKICVVVEPAHGCVCDRDASVCTKECQREQRWEKPQSVRAVHGVTWSGVFQPLPGVILPSAIPGRAAEAQNKHVRGREGQGSKWNCNPLYAENLTPRDCSYLCCMSLTLS